MQRLSYGQLRSQLQQKRTEWLLGAFHQGTSKQQLTVERAQQWQQTHNQNTPTTTSKDVLKWARLAIQTMLQHTTLTMQERPWMRPRWQRKPKLQLPSAGSLLLRTSNITRRQEVAVATISKVAISTTTRYQWPGTQKLAGTVSVETWPL